MNIELIFFVATAVTMPFWVLMIVFPKWPMTERIMRTYWPMVAPAVIYVGIAIFGIDLIPVLSELVKPSASGLAPLLGDQVGATLAWAHFLAFDLFVGRWIFLEARQSRTSAWLVSPILACTLMLGPVGFLLWIVVRRGANDLSTQ